MERLAEADRALYKIRERLKDCEKSLIIYFPGLKDELNTLKKENIKLEEEIIRLPNKVQNHIKKAKKLIKKLDCKP